MRVCDSGYSSVQRAFALRPYASDNGPRAGILVEDSVVDADTALRDAQLGDRVDGARRRAGCSASSRPARRARRGGREVAAMPGDAQLDAGDVTLHAPSPTPRRSSASAQLSRPRARARAGAPPAPILFPSSRLPPIGPGAPIEPPPGGAPSTTRASWRSSSGGAARARNDGSTPGTTSLGWMPFNDVSERVPGSSRPGSGRRARRSTPSRRRGLGWSRSTRSAT